MASFKIAGVQMDIQIGDVAANLNSVADKARETTANGAWLTIFPECTTTGYCFDTFAEAWQTAEPLNGPSAEFVRDLCNELDTRIVFGFLEKANKKLYNSVLLMDTNGIQGHYRKIHLPTLGVDRFTTPGDLGFPVFKLPEMKVGMNICYDSSFPEAARVLTLKQADLIVLPTNWPPTSGLTADVIPAARALENHVYFAAINRIGAERGFDFIGKSRICDPTGAILSVANHADEAILYADITPAFSRQKHRVNIPGQHEVHRIDDRHPSDYLTITATNDRGDDADDA